MAEETAAPVAPAAPAAPPPVAPAAVDAKSAEAPKNGATATEAPAETTYKVKVDGKEVEVTTAQLQAAYSKAAAADARFKEASDLRKATEADRAKLNQALATMKQDPDAIFKFNEMDPEEWAIQRIAAKQREFIEKERLKSLSPEMRELEERRALMAQWAEQRNQEQQNQEQQSQAAQLEQAKTFVVTGIVNTLKQFPESLQRSEALAQRARDAWEYALMNQEDLEKKGFQITPENIAKVVMKEWRATAREMTAHAKDEELDEFLAPTAKARLFKTQKAIAAAGAHPALTSEPQVREKEKPAEKVQRQSYSQMYRKSVFGGK